MTIENFSSLATTLGGGFFVGILVGYALKKVIKTAAVILGLFLTALAYLQYHQIATVNWDKLQEVSEGAVITFANIITQIPSIGRNENTTSALALSNFGIPLTGSMTMGFAIGFMKG
jgi:uncharacterized membrane protein (Fun14 family)